MRVNYVREYERFIEYAADERLTANEQLLWYALMHIFNQRAEGNEWPDGFIRVNNDRLFTYLPIKWDALARARNGLKQRGLIDFRSGSRNKSVPEYRIIPFYADCCPFKTDNMGGNMGGNSGGNPGDNSININGDPNSHPNNDTQTDNILLSNNARARGNGTYHGRNGITQPARYDRAYLTSDRARAAVAQRVIDHFPGQNDMTSDVHSTICEYLADGMPPEIMEDLAGGEDDRMSQWMQRIYMHFLTGGYEDRRDRLIWERCAHSARGDPEETRRLFASSGRYVANE